MKYVFVSVLLSTLSMMAACSDDGSGFKGDLDPRAVQLTNRLGIKYPELSSDSNFPLAKCQSFTITPVRLFDYMYRLKGNSADRANSWTAHVLKKSIEEETYKMARFELLYRAARQKGVNVSDVEIDSLVQNRYDTADGKEKFLEYLDASDISMADVRESLRQHIIVKKYVDEIIGRNVKITESDLIEAYQSYKVATIRQILLSTEGKTPEEKVEIQAKLEGIRKEALAGKDFSELAKLYSEDPASKHRGGLYPNVGWGEMVAPIEERAFSLPLGEISDVFESQYGYHIMVVEDRMREERPLSEVREELTNWLRAYRKKKELETLLNELYDKEQLTFTPLPFGDEEEQQAAQNQQNAGFEQH